MTSLKMKTMKKVCLFHLPIEKKRTQKITRLNTKTMKKVCPLHLHLWIEKKRTQKMTRLNTKTMKKLCHFSHADREEENTEDDQIEYESNEECVLQEMEDDIQVLDSQEERVGLLHEDIHQELVVKEMEIGELQLDNEVLEHNFIKLEEENQSLHVLMQLVQSQSIVHTVEPC